MKSDAEDAARDASSKHSPLEDLGNIAQSTSSFSHKSSGHDEDTVQSTKSPSQKPSRREKCDMGATFQSISSMHSQSSTLELDRQDDTLSRISTHSHKSSTGHDVGGKDSMSHVKSNVSETAQSTSSPSHKSPRRATGDGAHSISPRASRRAKSEAGKQSPSSRDKH